MSKSNQTKGAYNMKQTITFESVPEPFEALNTKDHKYEPKMQITTVCYTDTELVALFTTRDIGEISTRIMTNPLVIDVEIHQLKADSSDLVYFKIIITHKKS
jgi:hypothetical protein